MESYEEHSDETPATDNGVQNIADGEGRSAQRDSELNEDSSHATDDNSGTKRSADGESGSAQKRSRVGGDTEVRLLIPSRVARAIIGKGGHNITKLRNEYKGFITVPDCPGPERIVTISSDQYTAVQIVNDIIPCVEEGLSRSSTRPDEVDLRLLVHQRLAGCIIGKSGIKVQRLQEKTGARIKLFTKCCPQSSDRVCQVSGRPSACIETLKEILDLLKESPLKGSSAPYDPLNYDTYISQEYGGYTEESKPPRIGSQKRELDNHLIASNENYAIKREAESDLGPAQKRARVGGDTEIRLLIPSKVARGIIGRGGNNIRRLRSEHKGFITVPDCPGPERILTISSDFISALQILSDVIPFVEEASNRSGSRIDDVELRLLVHQSQGGRIIGKSGIRIQNLEEMTGARIKLFAKCCPQSTDRVCQVWGRPKSCVKAIKEIFELMRTSPLKGASTLYDPHNFDQNSIEEYGGYREPESKILGSQKSSEEGKNESETDRGSPQNDPLHLMDDDSGVKQETDSEKESVQKHSRREDDTDVRLLIPSKVARAIIGKGGHNISKLRSENRALITVPDCPGPERILSISSDLNTIKQILNNILPTLDEGSGYDEVELRLLVHRGQAGCIIGKSGSKIQKLQEKTGARIKLCTKCCPQSTDRVCQISGKGKATVECLVEIVELMETCPIKGSTNLYDPRNFDDYSAPEYGGYADHQSNRGEYLRSGISDIGIRSSGNVSPPSRSGSRSLLG